MVVLDGCIAEIMVLGHLGLSTGGALRLDDDWSLDRRGGHVMKAIDFPKQVVIVHFGQLTTLGFLISSLMIRWALIGAVILAAYSGVGDGLIGAHGAGLLGHRHDRRVLHATGDCCFLLNYNNSTLWGF